MLLELLDSLLVLLLLAPLLLLEEDDLVSAAARTSAAHRFGLSRLNESITSLDELEAKNFHVSLVSFTTVSWPHP